MENLNKKYEIENYDLAMSFLMDVNTPMAYKLVASCVEARVDGLRCEITMLSHALNETRKQAEKYEKQAKDFDEIAERMNALDRDNLDLISLIDGLNTENAKLSEDSSNLKKLITQYKSDNSQLANRLAACLDELKSKEAEIAAFKEVIETYRKDYYEYSDGLVTQYDEK